MKEYECQVAKKVKAEDGSVKYKIMPKTVWVNDKQLESPTPGIVYKQTGNTRMGYAKPAWVPEYNENGTICLLDDYVRASPQLLQACMDLILEQKYVSWSLPKGTTIVLTNNSDDGSMNVNSLDEAQQTRFLNYSVEWDENTWTQWAERAGIDNRCINFCLSCSDKLFSADSQGNRICNPRSYVMFAKMIAGIKDWDTPESLKFINTIAKGCFKDGAGSFASMFSTFIRNKLHLLISPKDMLTKDWATVYSTMESTLYDSTGQFRPDLASLLERRFSNYIGVWLDSDAKTPIKTVIDRIVNFIDSESKNGKVLFNKDLMFHMVKTITADHKNQTNKLLTEPKITSVIS